MIKNRDELQKLVDKNCATEERLAAIECADHRWEQVADAFGPLVKAYAYNVDVEFTKDGGFESVIIRINASQSGWVKYFAEIDVHSDLASVLISAGMKIERERIKKRFAQVREIIGL